MSKEITTDLVKKLRDMTGGVSVMQCRSALIEAEGDFDKAIEILKNKSADIALKKADRNAKDGLITIVGDNNRKILLTLHCETDFVAKNEDFVNLTQALAEMTLAEGIEKMKEKSLEMINLVVQKVGEKIELGKIEEITGDNLGSYIHNKKTGAIVSLSGGNTDLAKDLAMHIVAIEDTETPLKDQPFVKDSSITIEKLLANNKATIVKFIRESIN